MCSWSTGFHSNVNFVDLGAWPVKFEGGRLGAEKEKKRKKGLSENWVLENFIAWC